MGPRLGIIDEVPPGKLSVEVVKRLTGGDAFRAARKFQDDVEFKPRIKLTLASQHRLELQRVDVAMVRRFRLVPFGFTIPEGQENPGLERDLASEAPAILARLIDEAREYLRDPAPRNFPKSETIDGASREYVADEDLIQRFVDARCTRVGSEKSSILYSAFVAWANYEGITKPWGPRTFGEALVSKGFERMHTVYGNFYKGLSMK
jgi:putative DNA primase/helicase